MKTIGGWTLLGDDAEEEWGGLLTPPPEAAAKPKPVRPGGN